MSSYDESGQNEPQPSSPNDARSSKRRRIALACLDCRRRKLRCDRIYPACTRCQKGGHASSCTYDAGAVETNVADGSNQKPQLSTNGYQESERLGVSRNMASPASFVHQYALDTDESALAGLRAHIYRLENRIVGLEKAAHAPQEHPRPPFIDKDCIHRSDSRDAGIAERQEKELMMFRGKSFKTQFYGASHHFSYLSLLPKLQTFIGEMVAQHPGLRNVEQEFKGTKAQAHEHTNTDTDGMTLAQLLPDEGVIDPLVRGYIEAFESTYHVLHLPSFYAEYFQCLDVREQTRPDFIALLLVMMATTYCTNSGESPVLRGDSTLDREHAAHWIRAVDSWLALQSHKHVSPIFFQIHTILFIAQQVNSIKCKRTYRASGNLVRLAISAGLHRDGELVNFRYGNPAERRVTLFDQELRKRIWSSISELDLQVAIDRGMPPTMRELTVDCGSPLNTDDEDFTPSLDQLPLPKPTSEYTNSSFQFLSHKTFDLRQELVSLVNGRPQQLLYEDILQYDRKLMQALEDIPPWQVQDSGAHVSRTLLQLQLHQLQLLLHRPYVRRAFHSKRYEYSAIVHFKAALNIIDLHQSLFIAGSKVLGMMRGDILAAVLSISYNFSMLEPDHDQRRSAWSGMVGLTDPVPYLENALTIIEDKINRLGVGIKEYYCTCAVIGLLKKQSASTSPAPTHEYQAADKVLRLAQKMLSLQENFSAAATLASLPNTLNTQSNGMTGSSGINGQYPSTGGVPLLTPMNDPGYLEDFDRGLQDFDLTGWDLDAFFNF